MLPCNNAPPVPACPSSLPRRSASRAWGACVSRPPPQAPPPLLAEHPATWRPQPRWRRRAAPRAPAACRPAPLWGAAWRLRRCRQWRCEGGQGVQGRQLEGAGEGMAATFLAARTAQLDQRAQPRRHHAHMPTCPHAKPWSPTPCRRTWPCRPSPPPTEPCCCLCAGWTGPGATQHARRPPRPRW